MKNETDAVGDVLLNVDVVAAAELVLIKDVLDTLSGQTKLYVSVKC